MNWIENWNIWLIILCQGNFKMGNCAIQLIHCVTELTFHQHLKLQLFFFSRLNCCFSKCHIKAPEDLVEGQSHRDKVINVFIRGSLGMQQTIIDKVQIRELHLFGHCTIWRRIDVSKGLYWEQWLAADQRWVHEDNGSTTSPTGVNVPMERQCRVHIAEDGGVGAKLLMVFEVDSTALWGHELTW